MKLLKHKKSILLAIISLILIYFVFCGDTSVVALYKAHKQRSAAQAELAQLHGTIDSLRAVIKRLKNDSAYVEGLARENLGMAKPGETVYKFVKEASGK
jgi:cell division protein FtsB